MFESISALVEYLERLGVSRLYAKPLAENDNSKQQIYLGKDFKVINILPFHDIFSEKVGKTPTFKAKMHLYWVGTEHAPERAEEAKLILYPDYPEVRFSGFLKGCRYAPAKQLQPVPKELRLKNNEPDGRVLFFGVSADRKVYCHLAPAGTLLAGQFMDQRGRLERDGVLFRIPAVRTETSRIMLLRRLSEIRHAGWHAGMRLDKTGNVIPYNNRNAGGYTLEALFGVLPNGNPLPDYLDWELKAYSSDRITLMTPEPNGGLYYESGVKEFIRRYGHDAGSDQLYFTGIHRNNTLCKKTGLTLSIEGFDPISNKITNVDGGIRLSTTDGLEAASWSFSGLIQHWNTKHASAAYIPFERRLSPQVEFRYNTPVLLGEGTDFTLYLSALANGFVYFDPGSKIVGASTSKPTHKARSQFRINVGKLDLLYHSLSAEDI